ncbi:P-loop containing nucleoside triphosphate hydrolase protein [Trichodelitschia bisporula]|uniref:DNA 3'-5' helicase n=1 Tax=Trichodelitschia bisporula TaxID=703511 RepID=A0A6G1HXB7_9PEZI|nr:P-loop containing nucleoside triphosphate hydrolase protein [Trichodelitschia bisporula]
MDEDAFANALNQARGTLSVSTTERGLWPRSSESGHDFRPPATPHPECIQNRATHHALPFVSARDAYGHGPYGEQPLASSHLDTFIASHLREPVHGVDPQEARTIQRRTEVDDDDLEYSRRQNPRLRISTAYPSSFRSSPPIFPSSPSPIGSQRRHHGNAHASFQQQVPSKYAQAQQTVDLTPDFEAPNSSSADLTQSAFKPPSKIIQGPRLVSVRSLPDRLQQIFPFPNFNAVQSKCFEAVLKTDDNFVLSSPTGSGKTVIFELAICRLIQSKSGDEYKVVYQAPTKSLCSERFRDWSKKFSPLGLGCAELTGDTEQSELRQVGNASIIITTPEKWDNITRKWQDHAKLMGMVKLFLIDEVHIVKEERGATLEAVVARMKSIGSDVRFIALSATVPNSNDIAVWLGRNFANVGLPAQMERFGEEYRPVILQRNICGFPSNLNDFGFDKLLDSKLPSIIEKFSQKKPIMIFCMHRKSTERTAKVLAEWWLSKPPEAQCWLPPRGQIMTTNADLRVTLSSAVAFHHAGVHPDDRRSIEDGFRNGSVNVICCTSTLAMGVNLPCHLVIIKNTVRYTSFSVIEEYPDLEIMQMLGRAGRPQYDTSAVAVIITRQDKVKQYEKMVTGEEILESCLHLNLIEHLNAEIGLGTITDLASAKKWLAGTFLQVRLRANPRHYRLKGASNCLAPDESLELICQRAVQSLREYDFVRGATRWTVSEFGRAMGRYSVKFETALTFRTLPFQAKLSEILSALAQAAEFNDLRMRAGERTCYKELNDSIYIKFPFSGNLDLPAHKVSLVIQAQLGGIELPTTAESARIKHQFSMDTSFIFQHVHRLIRCIIDFLSLTKDSVALRNALMLCRSLGARCWDDSPQQLRQIEKIGIASVHKLAQAGIFTLDDLEGTDALRIEAILKKGAPFGMKILDSMRSFPKPRVSLQVLGKPTFKAGQGVTVSVRADIGFLNESVPLIFQRKVVYLVCLIETSDGNLLHLSRMSAKAIGNGTSAKVPVKLTSEAQFIVCYVMCDDIAGTLRTARIKPTIPSIAWPSKAALESVNAGASSSIEHETHASSGCIPSPDVNISARRRASEEFGDDDVSDSELLQAAAQVESSGFRHIDSYREEKQCPPRLPLEPRKPLQLPNGKYACSHTCKDKTACKHGPCCREGLDRPPRPSRPPKKPVAEVEPAETYSEADEWSSHVQSAKQSQLKPSSKANLGSIQPVDEIDLTQEWNIPQSLPTQPLSKGRKALEVLHRHATAKHVEKHRPGKQERCSVDDEWSAFRRRKPPEATSGDPEGLCDSSGLRGHVLVAEDRKQTENTPPTRTHDQSLPNGDSSFEFDDSYLLDDELLDLVDSSVPSLPPRASSGPLFVPPETQTSGSPSQEMTFQDDCFYDAKPSRPVIREPAPAIPERKPHRGPFIAASSASPADSKTVGSVKRKLGILDGADGADSSGLAKILKRGPDDALHSINRDDGVTSLEAPAPRASVEENKKSAELEGIDNWLVEEFGQYVDFI